MPKVLFTASTWSHIRNFHLPYLEAFRDLGWEVHAAAGGQPPELPFAGRAVALPFEKKLTAPSNFKAASTLRALIKQERYNLVLTHTSLAAFFTRLAVKGLRARPRVVNMVHGYLFDDRTPFLKKQLLLGAERLTAPVTDLVLVMNDWDLACAKRLRLGARVAYVPGVGVDFSRLDGALAMDDSTRRAARRALGAPEDCFLLVYAAEFSARKSQDVLIRAMADVPEGAVLALAGQGAELECCRALARELGVEGRVLFPGYVTDLASFCGAADAAVSSSRSEGLPFNIMEAMYARLPVAASAVKGHTDLVSDGETGLLYPYGDARGCAGAIARLMGDADLCKRLGAAGTALVRKYALDAVRPAVMAQYLDAASGESYKK